MSNHVQNADKKSLLDKDEPDYCHRFLHGIVGFIYMTGFIGPFITEIILLTQVKEDEYPWVLMVCGIIQALAAMVGGTKLGMFIADMQNVIPSNNYLKVETDDLENKFWCGRISEGSSIISGGYIIYTLPGWLLTNMIGSWVWLGNKKILPWYIHLMIYLPMITYTQFTGIGYATVRRPCRHE